MAFLTPSCVLALCLCCILCDASGSFRGGNAGTGRTVAMEEIEASLRDTLETVLQGSDGAAAKRLTHIEAVVWQTFQALPKNDMGRLAPKAVRYLVHNYFMKEHGWLIQGLEPHGNQADVSEMHHVSILQDKAPALVESILEARRSNHGLSIGDTVSMVAALERLIFDESLSLLQASYVFNGLTPADAVGESNVHEVLTSYLLLFQLGQKANLSDARLHSALKQRVSKRDDWPAVVEFEQDAVLNYGFARRHLSNPFAEQRYTFQDAAGIVEEMTHGYGKWQNTECRQMKDDLMELDTDGDGRIPVSRFYSKQDNTKYQFSESVDYMRSIGALDESGGEAKVRVANYLQGPSNCIASSTYYSICCLSECEGLLNELEGKVQAPTVEPKRLLYLAGNLSSATIDAPRQLPKVLHDRLDEIAGLHGGEVPLHGRLFSEWLHFAFPNECPYPQITEDTGALTPRHWIDKPSSADKEERKQLANSSAEEEESEKEIAWSSEEILHAHETPVRSPRSTSASLLRIVMQLAVLLGLLRVALSNSLSAWAGGGMGSGKKCDVGFELPF